MTKKVFVLGAGGHAKVVIDALRKMGMSIDGVIAREYSDQTTQSCAGVPLVGNDSFLTQLDSQEVLLANGIGHLPNQKNIRKRMFNIGKSLGFRFITVVHPSAIIADSVSLGEGCQVLAGAIIQADANIADNVIINTRATIEHDVQVSNHVTVSPGAILCGGAKLAECCYIGAGAIVLQTFSVGTGSVIAASSVVAKDIPENVVLMGAKPSINPI